MHALVISIDLRMSCITWNSADFKFKKYISTNQIISKKETFNPNLLPGVRIDNISRTFGADHRTLARPTNFGMPIGL